MSLILSYTASNREFPQQLGWTGTVFQCFTNFIAWYVRSIRGSCVLYLSYSYGVGQAAIRNGFYAAVQHRNPVVPGEDALTQGQKEHAHGHCSIRWSPLSLSAGPEIQHKLLCACMQYSIYYIQIVHIPTVTSIVLTSRLQCS